MPLYLTYALALFCFSSVASARVLLSLYALNLGAQPSAGASFDAPCHDSDRPPSVTSARLASTAICHGLSTMSPSGMEFTRRMADQGGLVGQMLPLTPAETATDIHFI